MRQIENEMDKNYVMSSFLMYRTIVEAGHKYNRDGSGCIPVKNSYELEEALRLQMEKVFSDTGKKVALALSGGIDSAILAKYMQKNSTVYTFQCKVPGVEVTNEVPRAARYAKECGLNQKVVEIYWEDFEKYAPILMKHKAAPIHSIEVQIYKAALQAKADGFDTLVFGESSDVNYGGMDGLLSRDYTEEEFVKRYEYVNPVDALKDGIEIVGPVREFVDKDTGLVDVHQFNRCFFFKEGLASYTNACECAEIEFVAPFSNTWLAEPLDIERVRAGENKYLVKDIFSRLYLGWEIPKKTPMPRPIGEWLKDWKGPQRPEFIPDCQEGMTGDQKWLIWVLEKWLDMFKEEN
mgnify:FL=1